MGEEDTLHVTPGRLGRGRPEDATDAGRRGKEGQRCTRGKCDAGTAGKYCDHFYVGAIVAATTHSLVLRFVEGRSREKEEVFGLCSRGAGLWVTATDKTDNF